MFVSYRENMSVSNEKFIVFAGGLWYDHIVLYKERTEMNDE